MEGFKRTISYIKAETLNINLQYNIISIIKLLATTLLNSRVIMGREISKQEDYQVTALTDDCIEPAMML